MYVLMSHYRVTTETHFWVFLHYHIAAILRSSLNFWLQLLWYFKCNLCYAFRYIFVCAYTLLITQRFKRWPECCALVFSAYSCLGSVLSLPYCLCILVALILTICPEHFISVGLYLSFGLLVNSCFVRGAHISSPSACMVYYSTWVQV